LGFTGTSFTPPNTDYFALPNRSDIRYHYFISGFTKQSSANKYRMAIAANTQSRIADVTIGQEFILPYTGVVHTMGAAFRLQRNRGVAMIDINIESLPQFGFDIRLNKDSMYFKNIKFMPSQSSADCLIELMFLWGHFRTYELMCQGGVRSGRK
jgi:hypothetical protein